MEEKRRAERWYPKADQESGITGPGLAEGTKLLDVSTAGMKISSPKPVDLGVECYGQLKVHPSIGPFFVKGKVVRVENAGESWTTAVAFQKVSTLPFSETAPSNA